ncbi:MAG: ImmA/IrrE family metallo-endopeptidase [Gemmatimonadetes bacterium]|nr:ImmA/IrrE family metallo-endopeptidase [Gemmatimonadota bacterium]
MPISPEILGQRLRSAREAVGLTQESSAAALELSRPAISELEAGRRRVSSLELARLAQLYGREATELLAPAFSEADPLRALFRAQPSLELNDELRQILLAWRHRARALTDLEAKLELPRRLCTAGQYPGNALSSRWDAIQQGERLAEEERARLGLGRAPAPELPMLLESQGVRTALVPLPDDISGLTLQERAQDLMILVNAGHATTRHRFSFAHEYAHVLIDRERGSIVSRAGDRDELIEMRANSFAAGFLMPPDGVIEFVRELGKGRGSRDSAMVFDESLGSPLRVEGRAAPGSQDLQTYDAELAARYFGVSRIAMIYRFKTLGLIKQPHLEALRAAEELRWQVEIEQEKQQPRASSSDLTAFQQRFRTTALEAYRREIISRGKLVELGHLIELREVAMAALLADAASMDQEADS